MSWRFDRSPGSLTSIACRSHGRCSGHKPLYKSKFQLAVVSSGFAGYTLGAAGGNNKLEHSASWENKVKLNIYFLYTMHTNIYNLLYKPKRCK